MLKQLSIRCDNPAHAGVSVTRRGLAPATALLVLSLPALLLAVLVLAGPLTTDPVALWSGLAFDLRPGKLPGYGTIDPNMGATAFALGDRAAQDLLSGVLPLWNHYEGLGTPLLGEMQSAALFPPTLLLLLPHGQMLEQILLQLVAGLGTFLFLRRFGLGVTAALAGGLLYEFNGVFAWLRNAIYNPVAFLPWLFYAVETLYLASRSGAPRGQTVPAIALGALTAALAMYAGFPEVVYFYSLPLTLWATLRGLALGRAGALRFLAALLAMALLALLIAAPLLLAFASYLPAAELGGHKGVGFRDAFLVPQSFLAALLPYVYGPIWAAPQRAVTLVWASIGGYLGTMPLLLAVAGLACLWRGTLAWLLAAWTVFAVGASHGVPILHDAMIALPLAVLASYGRYLDAGWIFCCVVLAACFIDHVPSLDARARRRAGALAAAVLLLLLAIALVPAWQLLGTLWRSAHRTAIIASVAASAILLGGFLLALRRRRAPLLLAALAVGEAAAAFLVPFASYPRSARIDWPLVAFLQRHAGLQRVAIASGTALAPNFGSAFGIPTINYDDLPAPARTVGYVRRQLDPASGGVIFRPDAAQDSRESQAARFLAHLKGYTDAGVRYVVSEQDPFAIPAYALADGPLTPVPLGAGQAVTLDIPAPDAERRIRALLVTVGTYGGAADGALRARLCQAGRCAETTAPIDTAGDNRPLPLPLDPPFDLAAAPYQLVLTKDGGRRDVALWLQPSASPATRMTGLAAPPQTLPILQLVDAASPVPVLNTRTATVFETASYRPYASAAGCRVEAQSQDRIRTFCDAPSRLLRLELFMTGWTATVNGAPAAITPVEDTFQAVALPRGEAVVAFEYAPPGVRAAVPIAFATALLCLAALAREAWTRRHGRLR